MNKFADGCHRWGWLINLATILVSGAIGFAYFVGHVDANIENMRGEMRELRFRVERLEATILERRDAATRDLPSQSR